MKNCPKNPGGTGSAGRGGGDSWRSPPAEPTVRAELIKENIFKGETIKELVKVQGELPSYFDKVSEDDWQKIIRMVRNNETGNIDKIILTEIGQKQEDGIGRQLLYKEVEKQGLNWEEVAVKISNYATKESREILLNMKGGEFFAEAFTAWYNGQLKIYKELQWLIDFFNNLPL